MRKGTRNIGIIGKDGSGKTMLAESMLFASGTIKTMGETTKGTTVLDFEQVEKKRGFTLKTSFANMIWKKENYNLIDTPAFNAFTYDIQTSVYGMDMVLLVVAANESLTTQSKYIWNLTQKRGLPSMGVITNLDKEDASYENCLNSIEEKIGKKPIILHIPYGQKNDFKGFIDLVRGKLYDYSSGKCEIKDIPSDYEDEYEEARTAMLEEVSMINDELTEKFMEEFDLTPEETEQALKEGFASGEFFPVVIASGLSQVGSDRVLDLIKELLPIENIKDSYKALNDSNEEIEVDANSDKFSALVFNTIVDPFLGNVSILKVVSGTLKTGMEIQNVNTDTTERIGNLNVLRGKDLISVDEAVAGDVIAITKLKNTNTGDTLYSGKESFKFDFVKKLNPVIQYALSVETKKDEDKLGSVMQKVMAADPSIELIQDSEMHQLLLAGQGQMQLQTMLDEVKEKYKVKINLNKPKVQYRETIKGKAEAQGKYKKQSGGKGQYGDCHIRVKPNERGVGFTFVDSIVGGVIPKNWIPSVEKGIVDAAKTGVVKGYPTIDFEVELFYGSFHAVDSSDRAFQVAGSLAYKKAMPDANPIILEPYMNLDIFVEEDFVGTIAGDISSRRGRVNGFEDFEGDKLVKVTIPQVEVLEYEPTLNQLTSGNGRFTMEFSHYEEFRGDLSDIPQNGDEEE